MLPAGFNVRIFCAVSGFLILACVILDKFPLPASPYSPGNEYLLNTALVQPNDRIVEYKLDHAFQAPRYDVGLFGNSRIIYVGKRDAGFSDSIRFFNFAVGGTSFRQSVRMIEQLAAAGKLPENVVISFDHVAFGYVMLPAIYPLGWTELISVVSDFQALLRSSYAQRAHFNTLVHTPVRTFANGLGRIFNPEYMKLRIRVLQASYLGDTAAAPGHNRSDGSVCCLAESKDPSKITLMKDIGTTGDYYPFLEEDFRRLAAATAGATRVIVYESPVNPAFFAKVESMLDEKALSIRQRMQTACSSHGFICPGVAVLKGDDARKWSDTSHAPADLLGGYIRSLLESGN